MFLLVKKSCILDEVNISIVGNIFALKIAYDWKLTLCLGCGFIVHHFFLCPTNPQVMNAKKANLLEPNRGRSKSREPKRGRSKSRKYWKEVIDLFSSKNHKDT